jgi:peptide/nickel transport system substrate-binding protein
VVDDTTWEFKLRKGVKFHTGDEFTADDVKYTFDDYLQEGKARSGLRDQIQQVEVVDPSTVRFRTKGPQAGLLDRAGSIPIMPKKAREAVGAEAFNQKPVGSGPYKVVEWARGQRVVFEANPDYWAGKVFPEKIVLRPIPDPTTRMAELKVGNVQIVQAPPVAALKEIQSDANLELKTLPAGRTMQYKFNVTQKPLDDVRVRQAMNYAIDRDSIIKNVLEGQGELMVGTFSKGWMGFDPNLPPYPYDVAKAKELLAAAGLAGGFETSIHTTGGIYLKDREIAEALAGQLEQVGIKLRIVVAEPTKLLSDWVAASYDGLLLSPWGTAADPDGMLGYQYYKRKAYQDPQLDQAVEKTRAALDPAQREKALQDLSRYVHDQALNLEVHSQSEFWAKRKNIQWEPYPIGSYAYAQFWRPAR